MIKEKAKKVQAEIFKQVKKYYRLTHQNKEFIPRKTKIPYAGRVYDEREIMRSVEACLDFWLTAGRFAKCFEEEFAKFLKVKFALLTNSGSSANLLAVSALTSPKLGKRRLKPKDEVITTACGFPTTLNPIIQNNLIPVLVDIELGTYNIDAGKIEKAISKKTKAIFVSHTLGNPLDLGKILQIVKKYKFWLIEDNCIDGNRCSIVKIDGHIHVLTIKEIYNVFHAGKYNFFEILSHGDIIRENDLHNLSDEFINILSKRQLDIVEKHKKYQGNTDKIITALGISKSSYYCSIWEIRRKMKKFIGVKHKWSKIKNVIFKGNKSVIRITQNFGQTCITKDHRLIVSKGKQLRDKYVEDFIDNNHKFINILISNNSKEKRLDLAKYLENYSQKNGSIKYDKNWIWFEYNKKYWKGSLSKLPKIKRYYESRGLEILCALFGVYCSEGSCGHELRFSSTNYGTVKLVVKYIRSISNLRTIRVSSYNPRVSNRIIRGKKVNSNKVVYSINMGHELINILFSILGGTDSYDKRVPNFIFKLDTKYMKVFYNYYIRGDGCRKSYNKTDFVITTASIKIASGINLLNNLVFKKFSRFIISKGKYYDVSPVKSLRYIKKKVNKIENLKDAEIYDIVVEGTSTFVDACGNVLLHNCDALGSTYRGKYTGTFGHISTCSFYPGHHMTMGEGGAVLTNNPLLKKIITSFRDWGRDCWCKPGKDNSCSRRFSQKLGKLPFGYDHKYVYSHIGYNLKITDIQAAIGLEQLKKLPQFIRSRKKNFNLLYQKLEKHKKLLMLPVVSKYCDPSWFGLPILVKNNAPFRRQDLVNYLEKNKIATRMLFGGNLIRQPAYKDTRYRLSGSLNNTDIVTNQLFWIGVYPGISREMIKYIIQTVDKFIN